MTPRGDAAAGGTLPCGTDSDALLTQVAEGRGAERDAHQRGCPHCRAVLAEYARLWGPVAEAAAAPVRAPAGVLDRMLAEVRSATGPAGWGRLAEDGHEVLIAGRVVIAVAGHAARHTPGVRMALGSLAATLDEGGTVGASRPESVEVGVAGRTVALEVTVAADLGVDLHRLADDLRRRVRHEVLTLTGLDAVEIAVTVDDVFPPPPG